MNSPLEVASSLERVYNHTKNRSIGMVSAHRAERTPAENRKLHRQLFQEIRQARFGYIRVRGRYVENYGTPEARDLDEHSFLVVGDPHPDQGRCAAT